MIVGLESLEMQQLCSFIQLPTPEITTASSSQFTKVDVKS